MRFGLNLLNYGSGTTPETLAADAAAARALGFGFLMISDHVAVTGEVHQVYPAPFYDQFTLAAWLAAREPGLTLGTTVTVLPYRHPLHTARLAANLHEMTGGRFVLGAGIGWSRTEYEALGVPFGERGRITDEYLAAIRAAWSEDPCSFAGRYVSWEGVRTEPRPGGAGLPVWVGGDSRAALRRAARFGEAWHPVAPTVAGVRAGLPVLAEEAERAGRPVPALAPRLPLRLTPEPLPEAERTAGQGTGEQIREDLAALEELGAGDVLLDTYPYPGDARPRSTPAQTLGLLEFLTTRVLDTASGTVR